MAKTPSLDRAPNIFHQRIDLRLGCLEFRSIKREKVVQTKIRLREFGEKLLRISQSVMPGTRAFVKQHVLAVAALLEFFVCRLNARLLKSKHLVVISVRQFVQHHPGLFVHLPRSCEVSRVADMDALGELL